jgi:1-acyl-sn-glycerol-3-phosphate acyltransferase
MVSSSAARKSLSLSLVNVYETFAISWPTVVDAALKRVEKDVCDDRLRSWAHKIVRHAEIELVVRGKEHMEAGTTYVIMSNHQSFYDVPVLFDAIGSNLRMITKKELFRVPVFGPALREAGFIEIDRSNRRRAVASLQLAKETLAKGVHVWIAPEGTRSKTGELMPFKKGGFNLALDAHLPVLPVTLSGTRNVLRAKGIRSIPGAKVVVTIHPPLHPRDYENGEGVTAKGARDRIMADVRKAVASAL